MDASELKDYIYTNDKVEMLLESLGCHSIRNVGDKIICCNPDGDNRNAVTVYLPSLSVTNYTRDLKSISEYTDIFTLVQFYQNVNFFSAMKYVCEAIGITMYESYQEDVPESLKLTKYLIELIDDGESSYMEKPLTPISEKILSYYKPYVNDMFHKDGISYSTQKEFEIGYDEETNRITIPIRNYDGTLVGVKGRLFKDVVEENESKYLYIEQCNKSRILYGLDRTIEYIENKHKCFVGESEKFVLQLYSYGDTNCVSTGGKTISKSQIEMLSRMNVDIVICFDKDVQFDELQNIADRFIGHVNVYAVIDNNNILEEHESPSDNYEKWKKLKENCIVRLR